MFFDTKIAEKFPQFQQSFQQSRWGKPITFGIELGKTAILKGTKSTKRKGGMVMVKGVHRKAIEILQPEDPCFERAIFFLSPKGELDRQVQLRARDYLRRAGIRLDRKNRWIRRLKLAGYALAWAAVGSGITWVLLWWLG